MSEELKKGIPKAIPTGETIIFTEEEKEKQDNWYKDDTKDFVEKYSVEKLQELTKNADFNLFAEGKIGRVPLAQIYESYQKLISKYEQKSVETAKQIIPNTKLTVAKKQLLKTKSPKFRLLFFISALKLCPVFLKFTQ